MRIFNPALVKVICLLLIFSIIFNIAFPTISYALTSGSIHPDTYGFQPVTATDNVSLSSGSFNYTIPLSSVPEYPMAYSYRSGLGIEDEASAFGFGGNSFPGAINRGASGLPDDIKGARIDYVMSNQPNWAVEVGASYGFDLMKQITGAEIEGFSLGASVSSSMGFDNYTGFYGKIGANIGASFSGALSEKSEIGGYAGLSMGFTNDSRQTVIVPYIGPSAGLTNSNGQLRGGLDGMISTQGYTIGLSLTAISNVPSSADQTVSGGYLFAGVGYSKPKGEKGGVYTNLSGGYYIKSPGAFMASQLGVLTASSGYGISVSIPIPVVPGLSVLGSWRKMKYLNNTESRDAFGFMHLGNGYERSSRNHLADAFVENEDPFSNASPDGRINPVHLQRDFFNISAEGLNGTMQLYNKEYGVVSRSDYKLNAQEVGLLISKNERKEIKPWVAASKAVSNKKIDFITKMKNRRSTADLTNSDYNPTEAFFDESVLVDLNSDKHKFHNKPVFKIRGDLAGEFNISRNTVDGKKIKANNFELIEAGQGRGDNRVFFLGLENKVPVYSPNSSDVNYDNSSSIEQSTQITYRTMGELLDANNTSLSPYVNTSLSGTTISGTKPEIFDSYYAHYNFKGNTVDKKFCFKLNDHLTEFNILNHLNGVKTGLGNPSYFNDLIAGIEVKNKNGMKYIFNLPVFAKNTNALSLAGKRKMPPVKNGNDYSSFFDPLGPKDRMKFNMQEKFIYPYAWNLTAIVGPDYIDFDNIPGPSDGDIGYWVKFKYVKTADDYRWRHPFTGLDHNPGSIHMADDDKYTMSTGTKELYYLAEIESSTHISEYTYHKRFDGVDARDYWNGDAKNELTGSYSPFTSTTSTASLLCTFNTYQDCTPPTTPLNTLKDPTGSNYQYAASEITVYKKHYSGVNSADRPTTEKGKKVSGTKLFYDYSTCPNVPNNLLNCGFHNITLTGDPGQADDIVYHVKYDGTSNVSIENGKLTLRKVQHFSYNENGIAIPTPAFDLKYSFDGKNFNNPSAASYQPEYNPSYDPKQKDYWGNYSKLTKSTIADPNETDPLKAIPYYHHYPEISKPQADLNAQAFKLSQIALPTGGTMEIEFEAKDYGFVEDKVPFDMRKVVDISYKLDATTQKNTTTLKVDITDLKYYGASINLNTLDLGKSIYAQVALYDSDNLTHARKDALFIQGADYEIMSVGEESSEDGRTYQTVTLVHPSDPKVTPLKTECINYAYGGSQKMLAIKQRGPADLKIGDNCTLTEALMTKYDNAALDNPFDAALGLIRNLANTFISKKKWGDAYTYCYGTPCNKVYSHLSFLRTPIYKAKYTGSRVKMITYKDGFEYATLSTNSFGKRENSYGTVYSYESTDANGKVVSSGVATIEPNAGSASVVDLNKLKGMGFLPSPSVTYAKTTVEPYYGTPTAVNEKQSRKKGKTVYEYYTAADYKFGESFDEAPAVEQLNAKGHFAMIGFLTFFRIRFKLFKKWRQSFPIPRWVTTMIFWDRSDKYRIKSYAYTDHSDMVGQLKSVKEYHADSRTVESSKQYNYYGANEAINIYSGKETNPFANPITNKRPGRMEQAWSEAYYTAQDNIGLLRSVGTYAFTIRDFNYINQKHIYVPPVLKEVVSTMKGQSNVVKYTGIDYMSGEVLSTEFEDASGDKKISRSVPAYWKYSEMGPADANYNGTANNLNILSAITAGYSYVQKKGQTALSLIDIGITEWGNSGWTMESPYVAQKAYYSTHKYNSSTFKYIYSQKANVKASYDGTGALPFISRNKTIVKPFRQQVFETDRNSEGHFTSFVDFVYPTTTQPSPTQDTRWRATSTVELYDAKGNALQAKDILGKYACSMMGYNMGYRVATGANASYNGIVFEGAENTYRTSTSSSALVLDDKKVSLLNAEVVPFIKNCTPSTDSKTLSTALFSNTNGTFVNITKPSTLVYNTTFAKLNATFITGARRTFFLYLDDNGNVKIRTNQGEAFEGFFEAKNPSGSTYLVFDKTAVTSLSVASSSNGFTASIVSNPNNCSIVTEGSKSYTVPETGCFEVHSGNYAFLLDRVKVTSASIVGTQATITKASLPNAAEFNREYSALVWVHNSSATKTRLVAKVRQGTTDKVTTTADIASPYVVAGEWSLLRVNIASGSMALGDNLIVYVENYSTDGLTLYDDLRVAPTQGSMTNTLYDHTFSRVISGLDGDNFASETKYNDRGRVDAVMTEVQNVGKHQVKKYLYNDQKKP